MGVILDPLVRRTELGLEILGPWAFTSLELSFLVHIVGDRGEIESFGYGNRKWPGE